MKVYIETVGCTFNQADSQIMAGILKENKVDLVDTPEDADTIIMNTCYVKHPTEQKVITKIKKMQELYPETKLLISGCMVEIDPEKLAEAAPEASWIGPHKIKSTFNIVNSVHEGNIVRETGFSTEPKVGLPKIRSNPIIHIIQICEGCDGFCTYCCTRFARGRIQSYSAEMIKKEAEQAVKEGCKEIQLTAQDTAAYGKDTDDSLAELINMISDIDGNFRLRVGMMHPKSVMNQVEPVINAFKMGKCYKFLHLPIQSGSNTVLQDMNRCHDVDEFKNIVSRFRDEIPDISISTDIIVGYPTETDDDFEATLNLISELEPDFLHISKYMHRPGTTSSQLEEIDHETMKNRSKALNDLKVEIALKKNRQMIGSKQTILITNKGRKGGYVGRSEGYKTVIVEDAKIGSFIDVVIKDAKPTYLMADVVDD